MRALVGAEKAESEATKQLTPSSCCVVLEQEEPDGYIAHRSILGRFCMCLCPTRI